MRKGASRLLHGHAITMPLDNHEEFAMTQFIYLAEKFAIARSSLMLPHSRGEDESIANAFLECRLGLMGCDHELFDDHERAMVGRLEAFMETAGLTNDDGDGLWKAKARGWMSHDDKAELSNIVDGLATSFMRRLDRS